MKRIICALLALMMLGGVLVACAEPGEVDTTTADPSASNTDAPATTVADETTRDSLPELNFGGEEIAILYWSDANNNEFFVEQTDGTDINDVVYKRNQNVQERLGFKFAWNGQEGDKGNLNKFVNYIRNGIDSGEKLEIIAGHSMVMGAVASSGYLQNLADAPYINLQAPWWPKDLVKNSTIGGNIYFVSGDISLNTLLGMEGLFFNKSMTQSNLYNYVHDKKWTLDAMFEESKNSYKDTNGDGKTEDDTYGYVTYSGMVNAMFIGNGIRITDQDADGKIMISDTYVSEKTQGLLEKINGLLKNENAWFYASSWGKTATIFSEGRSLFTMASVRFTVNELSNSGVTYGILPAPLYDEDQESYHTLMANTYTMYGISVNANAEHPAAVIEAMASEGYYTVTPVVFEVALKARYSDDSQDAMMFDVLRESTVMEIGLVFSDQLGGIPSKALFTMVNGGRSDWMSNMKVSEKKLAGDLKKLNDSFAK